METDVDIQEQDLNLDEEQQANVTDAAETEETGEAKEAQSKEDWDRTRQDLDFERANARKARAEAETLTEALEEANAKMSQLEEQLAELQQTRQEQQDKLDEMDPEYVHEGVAKNIQSLNRRLQEKAEQLEAIQKKVTQYEEQQAKAEAQRRQEQVRASVFDTVEMALSEAGIKGAGKYRNEANKLADRLVDTGEDSQPRTVADAVKLMTKCYLRIKQEQDKNTKSKSASVSVDTGKSGATPAATAKTGTGIKPGRLADVKAQMLKDKSWKG